MVVICDTSILTNLIQLGQLSLLKKLYGEIVIPKMVLDELAKVGEQAKIVEKISWISINSGANQALYDQLRQQLDAGESEAIALGLELEADLLLIDERKGRQIAKQHGLLVSGLLGILIEAKLKGHLSRIKPLLDKLILEIGFWVNPKLYHDILKIVNE